MENPIKMDDLGVPLFSETPIYIYIKCSLNIASIHPSTRKKVRLPANTADKERLEGIATGIGVLTPADILLGP